MSHIHMVVTFSIEKNNAKDKKITNKFLKDYLKNTRKAPGCLISVLLREIDSPNKYCLSEVWESQEALDTHVYSDYFKEFAPFIAKYMCSPVSHAMEEVFV